MSALYSTYWNNSNLKLKHFNLIIYNILVKIYISLPICYKKILSFSEMTYRNALSKVMPLTWIEVVEITYGFKKNLGTRVMYKYKCLVCIESGRHVKYKDILFFKYFKNWLRWRMLKYEGKNIVSSWVKILLIKGNKKLPKNIWERFNDLRYNILYPYKAYGSLHREIFFCSLEIKPESYENDTRYPSFLQWKASLYVQIKGCIESSIRVQSWWKFASAMSEMYRFAY